MEFERTSSPVRAKQSFLFQAEEESSSYVRFVEEMEKNQDRTKFCYRGTKENHSKMLISGNVTIKNYQRRINPSDFMDPEEYNKFILELLKEMEKNGE